MKSGIDLVVNAAMSSLTSRSGSCGGSMRKDRQLGWLPGECAVHAFTEVSLTDRIADATFSKYLIPKSGLASIVARIGSPIVRPALVLRTLRRPPARKAPETTRAQQLAIFALKYGGRAIVRIYDHRE